MTSSASSIIDRMIEKTHSAINGNGNGQAEHRDFLGFEPGEQKHIVICAFPQRGRMKLPGCWERCWISHRRGKNRAGITRIQRRQGIRAKREGDWHIKAMYEEAIRIIDAFHRLR